MDAKRIIETFVGIGVLLIAIFFFNYVYQKSGYESKDTYELVAKFNRADGLSEGTDVKISGIRVGKIVSMKVDPKSYVAVVRFYVSKDIKVPVDSSAAITSDGLFGGKYLAISPGGEDDFLKNDGMIEYTTSAISVESLISKFMFSKDEK